MIKHAWRGPEVFEQIRRNARKSLIRAGVMLQQEIKRTLTANSPSAPGSPPGVVTGTLRRSVQLDLSDIRKLKVRVGPNTPYAEIQEFGGTILPSKAKALAVPIGARGRQLARDTGYAGIRSLNLTYVPAARGKPPRLLEAGVPVFVLLRSVTLPPRPYVAPALKKIRRKLLSLFRPTVLLRGIR